MDLQTIIGLSTPTGSRVFGSYEQRNGEGNSDWDYIVNPVIYQNLWDLMRPGRYERTDYDNKKVVSYVFDHNNKKINLLIIGGREYRKWLYATYKMKFLCESQPIGKTLNKDFSDKIKRVALFEKFKIQTPESRGW